MLFVIGFILCISFTRIISFGVSNTVIQFPLRNIQNSIGVEFNSTFESNFTSEFHRNYKKKGYVLNLPSLNLPSVPNPYPGFIESKNVTVINLRENRISHVSPDSFISVPSIQYLDLSKNRLAFCNFLNYGNCIQNLITLVIEENELPRNSLQREINKAGCFPQLRYLYLRKNYIRRLEFSLRQSFPVLSSLYLSHNEIDDCVFIQDVPTSLAYLYVDYNRLSCIHASIIQYLVTLSADGNQIESICYENCDSRAVQLRGASKLKILSLAKNSISRIESCSFRDTYNLYCLNLSGNRITSIHPATFITLRSLAQLNLDDNQLTIIPNLRGNWHLKALSLRRNSLTEIKREFFSATKKLQKLYLGGNCIRSIQSDTFDDLTELQELDLSGNQLENLPHGWMHGLKNLKYLDLKDNRFVYVHQLSFSISYCLVELHLENNKYTRNDESSIQSYFPNARLYLDSCSYNSTKWRRIDYISEVKTYWEMNTQEKSDFSYELNIVKN